MPRWSVDIIRKRAEHLGTVKAPNERAAIKKAAERFDIGPENRISVTKLDKKE
jgi:1,2-phenylacetyl-CoA epoxidase PaaB subunit